MTKAAVGNDLRVVQIGRPGDADPRPGTIALEDEQGLVARAYRAQRDTAILLRPDGHIAWRGRAGETGKLQAWLRHVFTIN